MEAEDGLKPILQPKSVFRLVVFVLSDMEILYDRIADSHPSYGIGHPSIVIFHPSQANLHTTYVSLQASQANCQLADED